MNKNKIGIYEVLNPWAEVDPVPLQAVSPPLKDMTNKTIGLFHNDKVGAGPIHTLVETKLKEKFSTLKFTHFLRANNISMAETEDKGKYEAWLRGVDAVIFAAGD
jgi:hypothetical protein